MHRSRLHRLALTVGMPIILGILLLGSAHPVAAQLKTNIITDRNFLNLDSSYYGQGIDALLTRIHSPLTTYHEELGGQDYTAGNLILTSSQDIDYGVNPKVLIAILSTQGQLASLPPTPWMPTLKTLTQQLWSAYSTYSNGSKGDIQMANGLALPTNVNNGGSYALAWYFSQSATTQAGLQDALTRWQAAYTDLFGTDPQSEFATAASSPDVVPFLALPFTQPSNDFLRINSFFDHENTGISDSNVLRFDGTSFSGASFSSCTLGVNCYGGHNGLDYSTGAGRPVLAAAGGTVIIRYYGSDDSYLYIDDGNGYITNYYHMDPISVNLGDVVKQGDLVGYSGNLGKSSGAHLHFAVKDKASGRWIDPYGWWSSITDPRGDSRWLFQGDLIADDREAQMQFFYRTSWWYDAAGYGSGSFYTYDVNSASASTNWAIWTTYIQTAGNYEVFAYFPKKSDSTTSARYKVFNANGSTIVTKSQQDQGDQFISLGIFPFNHGQAAVILTDLTNDNTTNLKVYFDAIKWAPADFQAPTDISLDTATVAENAAAGTTVGTFTSTDSDPGDTFTYSLVTGTGSDDNAKFSISGAILQTAAVFNYETKNTYKIRVRSTDSKDLTFEKAFTISVTNVNETPTDLNLSNSTIAEAQTAGALVGALTTTDPDAGNSFTYTLVAGAGSTDNSSFAIHGNNLVTANPLDHEAKTTYSIRISSSDQGGLSVEKAFIVGVTAVDEFPPTDLSLTSSSIAENQPAGASIGTFSTTDADSRDSFTYSLVSGAGSDGNSSFQISGNALQSKAVFDYETKNQYSIRVRTTDSGGLTFEKALTVSVTNVNEAPTDISFGVTTFAETTAMQTYPVSIGSLSTTDPDPGSTFTYSLVAGAGSTNNNLFAIDPSTGAVTAIQPLDYETMDSVTFRVQVTDNGGLTLSTAFSITLTPVNEFQPADLALSNSSIPENQPTGALIGTLTTIDADRGDTYTYSVEPGNDCFTVNGNQLVTACVFDYEQKNSYSVKLKVTESGNISMSKSFTITILDQKEYMLPLIYP
jgi:murein DD-endopeptidase MepM/ murein hydrolase activator NlpD